MATWYDHPQYFDMVFRDETDAEVAFFEQAFERFAVGPVKRLIEPGCGSGRLVVGMAARGYDVTGLDLSDPMLRYARSRMRRKKLAGHLVHGDMTDIAHEPPMDVPYDAAFCTFNTFRHLQNDKNAISHLRSVASHVRAGGLYVLGFHIIPLDADPDCTERWRAVAGGTTVSVTLRVIDFNRRARRETLRVSIKATKRDGVVERIRSEFPLRLYTVTQVKRLLASVDDVWEVAGVFDFEYEIDEPREMDEELTDAVFVLRRR